MFALQRARRERRAIAGQTKRVVIVGAGPGGLASAMLLAHAGHDVTVLEREATLGGRSGAITGDGFRFDRGATFFLYPRILEEIFAACGRRLADEIELIRLDPNYRVIFGDGARLDASSDPARMAAEIARLAPGDEPGLHRYIRDNRAKLAMIEPVLASHFHHAGHLLRPAMLRSLPLLRPHRSMDSELKRYFQDPRVRLAFSFQSKYLGMSPFRCPSLFTILAYMEHEFGVFHPRGGCSALLEAMGRVATELGADIRTSEPVEEILFEGRRAAAVRTARGRYAADALVINADFATTMMRFVPERLRPRWSDRRIAAKKWSCSTFMLYLGIEGRADLKHHTIVLAQDYARNLADIEAGRAPPSDPSFYVQNAGVTDPSLAPAGHSTLYVLAPVPHRTPHIDWARERTGFRALLMQRLAQLGIPDLEQRIRFEKVVTPDDWEADLNIYRGATFNLSHDLGQMLHRRPRNRFEGLDGVFLVGGGTHPGSGLPVIFESARITSRLVAEAFGSRPAQARGRQGSASLVAEVR